MSTSHSRFSIKAIVKNLSVAVLFNASRKRYSFSWKYFGNLVLHDKKKKRIVDLDHFYCSACLEEARERNEYTSFAKAKIKSYNKSISTSNLTRHLRDEHKLVGEDEVVEIKKVPKPKKSKEPEKSDKQRLVTKDLVVWCCKSLIPLDSVCDEGMEDFFMKYEFIADRDALPASNLIQGAFEDIYEELLGKVTGQISSDDAPDLAMSFDSWTDQYWRIHCVTITLHYLTADFQLKKFNLCTKLLYSDTKIEDIAKVIIEVMHRFGLNEKNIYVITNDEYFADAALTAGLKAHLCLSNSLHNLVIVDGIKTIPEANLLVQKCRTIVEKMQYRMEELCDHDAIPKHLVDSLEDLMDTLQSDENDPFPLGVVETDIKKEDIKLEKNLTIYKESPTRYHCLLEMLETLTKNFSLELLNKISKHLYQEELIFLKVEWKLLEALVNFLKEIQEAVLIISSETDCSIHRALTLRSAIMNLLDTSSNDGSTVINKIKCSMLLNIDKRFPITTFLATAALLDHSFKETKQFDAYLESISSSKAVILADFLKGNHFNVTLVNQSSILQQLYIKHGLQDGDGQKINNEKFDLECIEYVASSDSNDSDLLEYWHENKEKYPALSSLARALLCVPALNVPGERAFSTDGVTTSIKRSRLHPTKLNKMLFIHDNYEVINT